MKKTIIKMIVSICLVGVVAGCASKVDDKEGELETVFISFDLAPFESIESMTLSSTDIIRTEVLNERVEKINVIIPPQSEFEDAGGDLDYLYDLFTVYQIRVLEVFKGDLTVGDIVEVRVLGGQLEDLHVISLDHTFLTVGDDLILFMHASFFEDQPFFLSSPFQATYRVAELREGGSTLGNTAFESLSEQNNLTLTIKDLQQIVHGQAGAIGFETEAFLSYDLETTLE